MQSFEQSNYIRHQSYPKLRNLDAFEKIYAQYHSHNKAAVEAICFQQSKLWKLLKF